MKSDSRQMLLTAINEFGCCDVTVYGESMKPSICSGDVVTIVASPPSLRRGQVVAFFNNDQLITHRITRRKKRTDSLWDLVVHGDSSPNSGGTVVSSAIIGVVACRKRNNRKQTCWFQFPLRLFAIPVGAIIRFYVCRTMKNLPDLGK